MSESETHWGPTKQSRPGCLLNLPCCVQVSVLLNPSPQVIHERRIFILSHFLPQFQSPYVRQQFSGPRRTTSLMCLQMMSEYSIMRVGSGDNSSLGFPFFSPRQIRKRVADVSSFYPPFIIFDAISVSDQKASFWVVCCVSVEANHIFLVLVLGQAAAGGIIRGAGKQKVGAISSILGYYGVGIPIGASLMFAVKMGITGKFQSGCFFTLLCLSQHPQMSSPSPPGLWIGLLTCIFLQTSFLIFYLSRLNWKKATEEVCCLKKSLGCLRTDFFFF